jgi:transposase
MIKPIMKRYSKAFKLQVVREYENGKSCSELGQRYGIGGSTTIRNWIVKYGREGLRHEMMVIQSPAEQDQVKALKQRMAQLEKVVAQLTLDKLMLETIVSVAEEELGIELKKSGAPG